MKHFVYVIRCKKTDEYFLSISTYPQYNFYSNLNAKAHQRRPQVGSQLIMRVLTHGISCFDIVAQVLCATKDDALMLRRELIHNFQELGLNVLNLRNLKKISPVLSHGVGRDDRTS